MAVRSSSYKTWVYSAYSAHHGLRPATCYLGGSIMALAFESGNHPLLIVSPPDRGGVPDHMRLGQESFGPASSDKIDS
jgi:hypothetical protein